jgi:transposase-like protein
MSQSPDPHRGHRFPAQIIWCLKFGRSFADKLRRRRPRPGDTWHLDEVFLRITSLTMVAQLSSTQRQRNQAI